MRILLTTLGVVLVFVSAAQARPRRDETTIGGVRHIENPEAPAGIDVPRPTVLWRRGGPDDDFLFGNIVDIETGSAGTVYVLDKQNAGIHVFSNSGEHLRTIGREGEGPGEFLSAAGMFLGPGDVVHILQMFPPKIIRLAPDGTPLKNFQIPDIDGGFHQVYRGRAYKDRIFLAGGQELSKTGEQKRVKFLRAFDSTGRELAHYHDEVEFIRFDHMKYDERTWGNFVGRWSVASDGRVAAAVVFDDYRIVVWNPDGSVDRVIERPSFARLERSKDERDATQERFDRMIKWNRGASIKISPTHRTVLTLWYRESGQLWVLSSRGRWAQGEANRVTIDVFDTKGRFVSETRLVFDDAIQDDRFFVTKSGFYRLTEEMELVSYRLDNTRSTRP